MSRVLPITVFAVVCCFALTGDSFPQATAAAVRQEYTLPPNTQIANDGEKTEENSQSTDQDPLAASRKGNSRTVAQWGRIAESRRLVIQSKLLADRFPAKAIDLAIMAANTTRDAGEPITTEARQQLYELTARIGGRLIKNESPLCSPLILKNGTLIYALNYQNDCAVVVEEIETGRRQQLTYKTDGVSGGVYNLIVSPNEEWLIATGARIIAWNLNASDVNQTRVQVSEGPWPRRVEFSQSGDALMALFGDAPPRKWTVSSTGFQLSNEIHSPNPECEFLFSPDGDWLLTYPRSITGDKTELTILNLSDSRATKAIVEFSGNRSIDSALISNDGRWIAVGGFGFCQLLQFNSVDSKWLSHDLFQVGDLQAGTTAMDVVAFSPGSKQLITSTSEQSEIWKLGQQPYRETTIPVPSARAEFIDTDRLVTLSPAHRHRWTRVRRQGDFFRGSAGVLRIWDYRRKRGVDQTLAPRITSTLMSIQRYRISPDAKSIATIDIENRIRLWNLGRNAIQRIEKDFFGHDDGILGFEFSNGGNYLITNANSQFLDPSNYSRSSNARIWDLNNPTTNMMATSSRPGHQLFFSDQGWLVTRNGTSPTYAWHFQSNESFNIKDARATDSRRWLIQRNKKTSKIWDLNKRIGSGNPFVITDNLLHFAITPEQALLAIRKGRHGDDDIQIFDLTKPFDQQVPKTLSTKQTGRMNMTFSDTARWLTVNTDNDGLLVSDLHLTNPQFLRLPRLQLEDFDDQLFASDDRWLVTNGSGHVLIRDLESKSPQENLVVLRQQSLLALSKQNGRLLTFGKDHRLYLWNPGAPDFQSTHQPLATEKLERVPVFAEFNETGTRLVVATRNGFTANQKPRCLVWEMESPDMPTKLREFEIEDPGGTVLSRDGNWLAYHRNAKYISLLNLETDDRNTGVIHIPTPRNGGVYNIEISSDSRWLAADGALPLLWDLNAVDISTSRITLPVELNQRERYRLVFSEDAKLIAVLTNQGRVCVWNMREDDLIKQVLKLAD